MKFEKIEWRNIFSYGNKVEELDFGDSGKLWQLTGRSGAGKSSLLVIPKLLLYGRTEGSDGKPLKTGTIANRINRNGWIRGTIRKGADTYVVERTFSPQGLTVYKNGEDLDKAGLKDMQGIIDNEIIDNLPYHIFSNVMTLSLNNFKSFVSMTPSDKRQIIDRIFSLEIINKVYELVKKDLKDLGNSINMNNGQIYTLEQTIRSSTAKLDEMSTKTETDNRDVLDGIASKLKTVTRLSEEQGRAYSEYYGKYVEVTKARGQLSALLAAESSECRDIDRKLKLFSEDRCPTCGTPFDTTEFDDLRKRLQSDRDAHAANASAYGSKISELAKAEDEMRGNISTIQANIGKLNAKKSDLTVEANSIRNATSKKDEYVYIQKIIDETIAAKKKLEAAVSDINAKMSLLGRMETLYSADGLKQQMMNNYIPTLNDEIRKTLIELSFPYALEFDNNFDPHFECLGEPIDVQTLSTGEHKKVDLAVLCSILKMLKRKYPQTNLVCLDETLSSLDMESSSDVILHLKDISREMNLNIFIVSHNQLEETYFDERIQIDKNMGFSDMKFLDR